ncbi:MAG: hotdog fold thioesterase [Nonlabens sp.]
MDKDSILERCNQVSKGTLMETLDISYVDVGSDYLTARMPVTSKVHQPDGVLHGGATAALAESVGSAATYIFMDQEKFMIRGLEITANHLKSVRDGYIYATARFIHKGRTTQLWEIKITNDADQLVSLCKLSTIALPKKMN